MTSLPRRRESVVFQEVGGEIITLDPATSTSRVLAPELASVWELCDGRTSFEAAATRLGVTTEAVEEAVVLLAEADLVTPTGYTRRLLLQRAALTGAGAMVAAPLMSVLMPSLAHAVSDNAPVSGGSSPAGPLTNGGFETGTFTGWIVDPVPDYASVETTADGMSATQGTYFARVVGGAGADIYEVVSQTFAVPAGGKVSGDAYFNNAENSSFSGTYNDDGSVDLLTESGTLVATLFAHSSSQGQGATPWTHFTSAALAAGNYQIRFRVRNVQDNSVASSLGVDNFAVS